MRCTADAKPFGFPLQKRERDALDCLVRDEICKPQGARGVTLTNLGNRGWIIRIQGDTYAITNAGRTAITVDDVAIAKGLLRPAVGAKGSTADCYRDLTETLRLLTTD